MAMNELHIIFRNLERGLVLTRFHCKKKPEKRTFQVKLETRELVWIRAQGNPEGTGKLLSVGVEVKDY